MTIEDAWNDGERNYIRHPEAGMLRIISETSIHGRQYYICVSEDEHEDVDFEDLHRSDAWIFEVGCEHVYHRIGDHE